LRHSGTGLVMVVGVLAHSVECVVYPTRAEKKGVAC
jgi:hypothetical protein